jgi:hypothetical protein|tara:strand:- start:311 stop:583 length:273 start_codon:yes stop_codon:yes gene_type:complete
MQTIQDNSEMLEALESLVDKHGIAVLMLGLVHIADEKAESWKDTPHRVMADTWRKVSDALISKRLSNALNRLPAEQYGKMGYGMWPHQRG